jgi:hypothetical protein
MREEFRISLAEQPEPAADRQEGRVGIGRARIHMATRKV